jgi:hypothetical protein
MTVIARRVKVRVTKTSNITQLPYSESYFEYKTFLVQAAN